MVNDMSIVNLIRKLFKANKPKPPEFRLVPDEYGFFELQQWDTRLKTYVYVKVCHDKNHAERILNNLNRETLYWTGRKTDESPDDCDGVVVL